MRWYFDYISPYAYLQSTVIDQIDPGKPIECVPILFAGLLDHWGNVGPAEINPKREWTFKHVTWLAQRDNIPLTMPTHHPFNPLPLLRLGIALGNDMAVVKRLFRFVWVDGHVPQDNDAFSKLLDELGATADMLSDPAVKSALLANGQAAIDRGVFGVPSIEIDDEVFWGYDGTDTARDYLNKNNWPSEAIQAAIDLPAGPGRRTAPNAVNSDTDNTTKSSGTSHTNASGTRIAMKPIDLAEPADVVNAIRQRRGGELLELDRLLLYSTPLATGWNHLLGNVRTEFSVKHKLRELAMCTVAVVNRAEYEFSQHAPIFIKAGGSEEKTELLRNPDAAAKDTRVFDSEEIATILLATEMTRDVQVTQQTFDRCLELFNDTEVVELVATVAAYNMVSRFLVAMNLHP
jgi:2-hydroxychromene-2-carboxylate isomerase/alkylhydroperoxidase family enzyme